MTGILLALFLMIALISGTLGFAVLTGIVSLVAKALFLLFLILFLAFLFLERRSRMS
ncbi:MAG: DUF1328 domain-containing protein [Desulfobacteraceae bacterium]|nr:DUF1328 domain-containing protein [Desulfobacteraceae bacterium]